MYEIWLFEVATNFEECWNDAWVSFAIGCWIIWLFDSTVYKLLIDSFEGSGGLHTVRRLCEARSLLCAKARPHILHTYGFSPEKVLNKKIIQTITEMLLQFMLQKGGKSVNCFRVDKNWKQKIDYEKQNKKRCFSYK